MCYAHKSNDRIVMWGISPVAATALLLSFPLGAAVGVGCTAWNVLRRTYLADMPLMMFATVLALLRFTASILDSRMYTLGSFVVPDPGPGILLMATLAAITINSSTALRRWHLTAQP